MYIYDDKVGKVELVSSVGNDLTCVNAARVSYGKHKEIMNDADEKLIKYMIKEKHTSVFEHCFMTFRFKVPMFVRSQHHRHRTWSYNEISRRYTSENLEFYEPTIWRIQAASSKQASISSWELDNDKISLWNKSNNEFCLKMYNNMIDRGVAREMARMVLPQSLYTEYYGSVNLKNAIDFLRLRLHPHAQYEIRKVAEAMEIEMKRLYPITMSNVNFDY